LNSYEIEIELEDIMLEEGYPKRIDFDKTYFVPNDGTFDERIQTIMKFGADSVSFSKSKKFIEFKLIKK
jgi:hypothetical protein